MCNHLILSGATISSAGTKLNFALSGNDVVAIKSLGTSYELTISSASWSGTATGVSFSGSVLTVSSTGLAAFDTLNFNVTGAFARVNFADSGINAYSDHIIVNQNAQCYQMAFTGATRFTGNNGISITTAKDIVFNSGSSLTTENGDITLLANTQAVATSFYGYAVFLNYATIQITGTGILTIKGRGPDNQGTKANSIVIAAGSKVIGGTTGTMTVEGTIPLNNTKNMQVGVYILGNTGTDTSMISSNGANVLVKGIGTDGNGGSWFHSCHGVVVGGLTDTDQVWTSDQGPGKITSGGNGTVTVIGTGGGKLTTGYGHYGVLVRGTGKITSGGSGKVTVSGTGGGGNVNAAVGNNYGVRLQQGGSILSGANADIEITGIGGGATGAGGSHQYNHGISVSSGLIQPGPGIGSLTMTGTGGKGGAASDIYGVELDNSQAVNLGTGNINITGTGGGGNGAAFGILIKGTTGTVKSASGNITLAATGGNNAGGFNFGLYLLNGGYVSSEGNGDITINSIGGSSQYSTSNNYGLNFSGGSSPNYSRIVSNNGNITITTTGGSSNTISGSGSNNHGLYMTNNVFIQAGGAGNVKITAFGGNNATGNTGTTNHGISLSGCQIKSTNGNIDIVSTAGSNNGTGNTNYAIFTNNSKFTATGNGAGVTIHATGSSSTGSTNEGLYFYNASTLTGGGGDVILTGIAQNNNIGLHIFAVAKVTTVNNGGDILMVSDKYDLSDAIIETKSTDTISIRPYSNGIGIDLGSASNNAINKIEISSGEFGVLNGGTVLIGDTKTGDIKSTMNITSNAANLSKVHFISADTSRFFPVVSGSNEITASGKTIAFHTGQKMVFTISGKVADTGYSKLSAAGTVHLGDAILVLDGTYVPVLCDIFTIISATNVTGTFNGLMDGDSIPFNGRYLEIYYSPTSVVLKDSELPTTTLVPGNQSIQGTENIAISSSVALMPTGFSGSVSYSISPALPAGLILNASTGVISGTPSSSYPLTTHYIIGRGATCGKDTSIITIQINLNCPTLSTAPSDVSITNSGCDNNCVWSEGTISPITCAAGAKAQYQVNGGSWNDTVPLYSSSVDSQMIKTRCVCLADTSLVSPASSGVKTSPITSCSYPTAGISIVEQSGTQNDGMICSGETVTLSAQGGATYIWNTGSSQASISMTPMESTTYTVTVTNENGCSASTSQIVIVNTVNASISGPTTGCGSVTLTATGGIAYLWNAATSPTSATNVFNNSGTYTVTVTTEAGCQASASLSISVLENKVTKPVIEFIVQPRCEPLIDGKCGLTGLPAGNWTLRQLGTVAKIMTGSGNSHVVDQLTDGVYRFVVIDQNGCSSPPTSPFDALILSY